MLPNGDAHAIVQWNAVNDTLEKISEPSTIYETLNLYIGLSKERIQEDINEKIGILKWMAEKGITDLNKIGSIMSNYYRKKPLEGAMRR